MSNQDWNEDILNELDEAAFPSSASIMPITKTNLVQPHQVKPVKPKKQKMPVPPKAPKPFKPVKQQTQRMTKKTTYNPFKATTMNPNDNMLGKFKEDLDEEFELDEGFFDRMGPKLIGRKKQVAPETQVAPLASKTSYTRKPPIQKPKIEPKAGYKPQQTDIIKQLQQASGQTSKVDDPSFEIKPGVVPFSKDPVRQSIYAKAYAPGNKNPIHIAASVMDIANLPKKKKEESQLRTLINVLKEDQDLFF